MRATPGTVWRRRATAQWLWVLTTFLVCLALSKSSWAQDPFARWPAGWVSAYQRFETFNATRAKYNPATNLEFSPSGAVFHSVPVRTREREKADIDPGERQNLGLVFFSAGCEILSTSLPENIGLNSERAPFPRGSYAACVKVSGFTGYQHLAPLVWFDVVRPAPRVGASPPDADAPLTIQMVAAPEPAEDFWPNERLLQFLDFTVFPKFGLPQVLLKNERVRPDVVLEVTNSGTVKREELDGALEELLRWRIYHNGRLIEKGPAKGVLRYDASRHGVGSYMILLGVDGPTGFLPVSNHLHFPLFPEKGGICTVLPAVTNAFRFPDFLLEILSPADLGGESRRSSSAKDDDHGHHASETIYAIQQIETLGDERKDTLLHLWQNWGYEVNLLKSNPKSELNRLPVVP